MKELAETADIADIRRYQSAIRSLMYAMIETRPDIAYAVSTLSQFASNLNQKHWKALKHLFRYLRGTLDLGITYCADGNQAIVGYTDSDWAGDKGTQKSATEYLLKLANGAVSWSSKQQPTVALSSSEAKYMAATQCVKEAIWIQGLLKEIGYQETDQHTISLFGDNMGALALAQNPEYYARKKHINVQWHFVREKILENLVQLEYLQTEEIVADGLIKPLGKEKFYRFISLMGMI